MNDGKLYSIGKRLVVVLLVVLLGLLVVNQYVAFRYKAVFLGAPCKLCQDLNPEVVKCFTKVTTTYPDGKGGWYDPSNISIINISLP